MLVRFFWRAYLCEYLGGQRGRLNRYPERPIEPRKPEECPMPQKYFVSLTGDDSNPGTSPGQPFRHVQRGVDALKDPGDVLQIREGVYVESVVVDKLPVEDTDNDSPIIIEAFDGEDVVIDAGYEQRDIGAIRFRQPSNGLWDLVDPVIGEYVSHLQFEQGNDGKNLFDRAAFIGLPKYTRLIRYSDIRDLQSDNQRFGTLPESLAPAEGPFLVDEHDNFITIVQGPYAGERKHHPWVYMGPGIHHALDKRLHVRLQPTEPFEGITAYAGETDPNNVGLSVSREVTGALTVSKCHNLIVRDLTLRFGGRTLQVRFSENVIFDRVRIFAGPNGVHMGGEAGAGSTGTVFRNCTLDGGIPPWCFRTDQKDQYRYRFDTDPVGHLNKLAEGTSGLLMSGDVLSNQQTEVRHCEFVRGLDLLLVGQSFSFHHNVVDEMQDDALAIGFGLTSGDLHENVILRCQTAMSFAGSVVGGPYRIFRNLFDLRSPIAAIRPRPPGDLDDPDGLGSPFRFGQFYKGKNNGDDGPIDLFQNTCLVRSQEGATSFQFYRHSPELGPPPPLGPRRSFNNIFVDVEPAPKGQSKRATAYLPTFVPGSWPTDGSCYFRVGAFFENEGPELTGVLRHEACLPGSVDCHEEYSSLAEYRAGPPGADEYFQQSKILYAPGYERRSLDVDPKFRGFDPSGLPNAGDDLRLRELSPAAREGVILNAEVNPPVLDPGAPIDGRPDMGCFQQDGRLEVGVDGLMTFP
jgi:hypothetical protein